MNDINHKARRKHGALIASVLIVFGAAGIAYADDSWPMAGQSTDSTRHQKNESKISPETVGGLTPQWVANVGADVSATPAVEGDFVYFPTWSRSFSPAPGDPNEGKLIKIERATGNVVWERLMSDYTGIGGQGAMARTTPAISKDLLIFGDQGGRSFQGATLIAVNKHTGNLVWANKLDAHPAAFITQSATVHQGVVYVGVASNEELYASVVPGYVCCTFKGSMAAVDAKTGATLWQTEMTPAGFSGNAIWGSSASIDTNRKSVYIATGNNYSAPAAVLDCVADAIANGDVDDQRACIPADNYFDAIVALDMDTGAVKWSNTVIPFDVWTVGCIGAIFGLPEVNCPDPAGPDFDFGQSPMIIKTKVGKKTIDLVGAGQKSGIFWALDPDTGAVVWQTQVDTGGIAGGIMWGSAFDGTHIYTSSANSERQLTSLADGSVTFSGLWSALDPATGEIVWQTANPTPFAPAGGAVSSANGVVFACSQDAQGYMYALDGATGSILWQFASGGSCNSGAAIVDGEVYWGSGYIGFGPPNTGNTVFHSFKLP